MVTRFKERYAKNLVIFFLTSVIAQSSLASNWHPDGKLMLQLGAFNAHQGTNQNIAIEGLVGDRFTVTQHNDSNILVGLGYYLNGLHNATLNMMYGLNAFYLAQTVVKGKIIQEELFTNLSYQYSVKNYPIYIVAKALFNNSCKYNLTLDMGLGANIIKTGTVDEKSLDGFTLPDQAFSGKTTTAFSATLGLGVKFNTLDVPVECGYRFFYLGKGYFQKESGQLNSTLNTGNGYANAIICSVMM